MRHFLILIGMCLLGLPSFGQGIHFSQYYNAPQLLNPANTALIPTEDYQVGVNYREQWSNVPAAFKTIAAHGDFQLLRNKNLTNWMGIGVAFFSDKAGAGILSLDKVQASLAYHVQLNDYNMISAGISGAFVQRSIDFSRLTFDAQWDGMSFNKNLAQQEPYATNRVRYADVMLGVNYAYFPNPDFYLKIGAGAQHLNRPNESFYRQENRLGIRPMANVDALIKAGDKFIINPSLYYAYQKKASELVAGALFNLNVSSMDRANNQMIMGVFYRWNESFIPVVGIEWTKMRLMCSFDATTSGFSKANRSFGAIELSLSFKGLYSSISGGRDTYNCPRF
jgi:type IX secretion system PorP/SprF family membrane protein